MSDSAPFVGRNLELRQLDAALLAAHEGRGAFVLVAGEPGIGKTTLCTCFSERARQRGARVLWGRAWEWGGAPPFWPWVQVLRGLTGEAADEPSPRADTFDALARISGQGASFSESDASARFALFDMATERLRAQAQSGGTLVIVLEDLHAADVPSLLLLRFAIEQLRDAKVLVIGTWRTVEASPSAEASALIAEASRLAQTLDLYGLGAHELAEIIARAAPDAAPELAAVLHDRTGGNPLLVSALLQSDAHAESEAGLPLRARAAVERRVARVPEPARAVLSAASVIGREVAVLLLARVCERPLEEVLEQVRVLSAQQILIERPHAPGRYGFCHGLFREVVYAALPPADRLRLHRAAGLALETLYGAERDAHLPELARHFLAVYPDAERGVDYAVGAGRQAMRSLAYEEAAAHFSQAIAALEASAAEPRRIGPLWLQLAYAQAAAGTAAAARESYRRAHRIACDSSDHTLAAQAAVGFARATGFGRADDEPIEWLERALERTFDAAARVRLLGALVDRIWVYPGSLARVDALLQEALELARQSGDRQLIAEALASSLVMTWIPDPVRLAALRTHADELLAIAEALGDPELRVEAYRWRFTLCMIGGALDEAKRVLETYERLADRLVRPQLRFNVLLRQMMLACLEGRYAQVERALPHAERAGRRAGDAQASYLMHGFEVHLARVRDDRARLEQSFRRFMNVVASDLPRTILAAAAANTHAQLGNCEEARRALDSYFEVAPSFMAGGGPIALAFATWAVFRLGLAGRARELLPVLAPCEDLVLMGGAVEFHGPGSLYLGLAAATAGAREQAERQLQKAVAVLDRLGAGYHAAQARNVLGLVLSASDPARASALRSEAREAARMLGGIELVEPIAPFEWGSASAPLRAADALPDAAGDRGAQGIFAAEGDYYTLGLGGKVVRARCSKGLAFIERLLRSEGAEVHVLELTSSVLHDDGGSGPVLDARAKAAYRERIELLRAELAEAEQFADGARALRAREELDALLAQLSSATGLFGRDRAGGSAERARARATLAIRRAIKGLERVHPALAAHFASAIATGTFCSYRPEPRARVTWRFEPPVAS